MSIKQIDSSGLTAWVAALIEETTVYGVQAKEDRFAFGPLRRAGSLRLDYDVTILPPKKYFQPQKEVLMTFDRSGKFESVIDEEPFVLFGVHPYDMVAILQLDTIFAEKELDSHYTARRRNGVVVVSDVQAVSDNTFAGCMGNATIEDREGYDILLTKLDDGRTVVDSRTEAGEKLMQFLPSCADAGADALAARETVWKRNREGLTQHKLNMAPEEIPALLERSHDSSLWAEKADLCYSCGACNLVCPTCYCFDVDDEFNWDLATGQRTRQWDGCMLTKFAVVAGDHNFRPQRAARYRHRYYRKGKYVFDMIGELACVGCGRCITACTANIANPVDVFNSLMEDAS